MRKQKTLLESPVEEQEVEFLDNGKDEETEKVPEKIQGVVKLVSPEYVIVEINGNNQHFEINRFKKIPHIGDSVEL